MSFKNPPGQTPVQISNWVNTMNNIEDPEDLISFIDITFPGFIEDRSPSFTQHLSLFDKNWQYVSEKCSNGVKRDIIIVNGFDFKNATNPDYSMINSFMSTMTQFGFCIRSSNEIQKCTDCDRVLLSAKTCKLLNVTYSKKCHFYNKKLSNIIETEVPDS